MTDKETIFYAQIGLITIEFAKLEELIRRIIGKLINSDNDFVNSLLLENSSLQQNLNLLLRLNKYRALEGEKITGLCKTIEKLKINRNLFIHGVWSMFTDETGKILYICETDRVTFKKVTHGLVTMRNTFDEFTLEDLQKEVAEVKICTTLAGDIWEKIEDENIL